MSAPPFQKFFWGSYHKHTSHLSDAREHGAYLLLIGALWNNDGKLPADDVILAGYAKVTVAEWEAMKPKLMPLFRVVRGKLTQHRVTEDLSKYEVISCKRKQAGKSGGKASGGKRSENSKANASILPTYSESEPELEDITPQPPSGGVSDDEFDAIWSAYPEGGRATCPMEPARQEIQAAAADGCDVATMLTGAKRAAAHAAAGGKPKRFDRWARDRLFLNDAKPQPAVAQAWDGPAELWDEVARFKGPGWAASYLGACTWRDGALVTSSKTVARRLEGEVGQVLSASSIRVQFEEAAA